MQYFIPESNLREFEKRSARLVKRATKLGAKLEVTIRKDIFEDREHKITVQENHKEVVKPLWVRYISVTVEGDRPKFQGWDFIGTLEHTSEGNVMRLVPQATAPEHYRNQPPCCDHCKAKRTRKDTYLVHHEDGRYMQVGRNCLADFLGHANPQQLAELASIWVNIDELGEAMRSGGGGNYFNVERYDLMRFLGYVAQIVLSTGTFYSRTLVNKIREERGEFARVPDVTADLAHRAAYGNTADKYDRELAQKYAPTDEANQMAEEARNWVLRTYGVGLTESDDLDDIKASLMGETPVGLNEFEHNLLVVAKGETCERRTFGIAAYIIQAYRRANNLIVKKEKRPICDKHIGQPKDRLKNITVTCDHVHNWDSDFGQGSLFKLLLPDGVLLVWKTYNVSEENNMIEGHKYVINGTIKAHGDYKGEKQTVLSRVNVLAGVVEFKAPLTEESVAEVAVAA